MRRIVFLTGTRADFGKLKALIQVVATSDLFDVHIFVTGMHMLSKYGYTCEEVEASQLGNVHKFINQNHHDGMDAVLAKTIAGFSDYIREIKPDLIIVHGDRVEALAGASVGALNNILVAHVEGGEVSGTVDELMRHAITKMSHIHFVANEEAANRLLQLGEVQSSIFKIGSPDVDIMNSSALPSLDEVRSHYDIEFDQYGVLMFHPVTTELENIDKQIKEVVDALIASNENYVVIYPNNDHGSDYILKEYHRLWGLPKFRVFPSMRFEFFLTLLKHASVMVGNSSAGVREAPHFGVPTLNVGSRQNNRAKGRSIINVPACAGKILTALEEAGNLDLQKEQLFGDGNSAQAFFSVVSDERFWKFGPQKNFVDRKIYANNSPS